MYDERVASSVLKSQPTMCPASLQVDVQPRSIQRLASVIAPDRYSDLVAAAQRASHLLTGRIVWNINSTASGGGGAEMLQTLLAYGRGAGVDTR